MSLVTNDLTGGKSEDTDEEDDEIRVNCNSILYRIIHSTNTKSRDLILEIASNCEQFSLSKVFITQDDVKKLLDQPSLQVIQAFDNILRHTAQTK